MVYPVFHVSMLRKFIGDENTIVPLQDVTIEENLSYEELPVEILDRQVKRLRNKEIASVKVLWRNQYVKSATWEAEEDMKKRYPHLFPTNQAVGENSNSWPKWSNFMLRVIFSFACVFMILRVVLMLVSCFMNDFKGCI